jgi:hypothetical protein
VTSLISVKRRDWELCRLLQTFIPSEPYSRLYSYTAVEQKSCGNYGIVRYVGISMFILNLPLEISGSDDDVI